MECPECGTQWHPPAIFPIPLTPRQKYVLDFIIGYSDQHGFSPTFQEIANGVGVASKTGVSQHLANLEDRGWITRLEKRARSILILQQPAKSEAA